MKKFYTLMMILTLLSVSLVSAESMVVDLDSSSYGSSATSDIQVRQLRYEPYPVNPGEYFTLWIKVENVGSLTKNAIFELMPKFPFTLDSNEDAVKLIENAKKQLAGEAETGSDIEIIEKSDDIEKSNGIVDDDSSENIESEPENSGNEELE